MCSILFICAWKAFIRFRVIFLFHAPLSRVFFLSLLFPTFAFHTFGLFTDFWDSRKKTTQSNFYPSHKSKRHAIQRRVILPKNLVYKMTFKCVMVHGHDFLRLPEIKPSLWNISKTKKNVCFRKCACIAPKNKCRPSFARTRQYSIWHFVCTKWLSVHRILRNWMELNRWLFKCSFDSIVIFAFSDGKSENRRGENEKNKCNKQKIENEY